MANKSISERSGKVLSADPEFARFNITGGKSEHMLVNCGEKRLAIKVRCSNNNLYRITPVVMFIEQGQCQNLVIQRMPGPARNDKLIIQFAPCEADASDCKELFKKLEAEGKKPDTIRIELKMDTEGGKMPASREIVDNE